jgi:hypothetical protein
MCENITDPRSMTREQLCGYIAESLDDLPDDILRLIYRIVAFSESGLE